MGRGFRRIFRRAADSMGVPVTPLNSAISHGRKNNKPDDKEGFVDRSRYRGVCYQAANWHRVGQSAGRGRNDRHHRLSVPAKDIYLYPLSRDFRRRLCDAP